MKVFLLPGFNGGARQPLLARLGQALPREVECHFPGLPKGRPSAGLAREVSFLEAAIARAGATVPALVGRSFGGRVALRYALGHATRALVLLGFPVRPEGRARPDDEAALAAVRAPTLIVQGADDEKGPLDVIQPIVRFNRALSLLVLPGVGHHFGGEERAAIDAAVDFLSAVSRQRTG